MKLSIYSPQRITIGLAISLTPKWGIPMLQSSLSAHITHQKGVHENESVREKVVNQLATGQLIPEKCRDSLAIGEYIDVF